jgi:surface antigen
MRASAIVVCLTLFTTSSLSSIAHSQTCPALGPKAVIGAAVGAGAGAALGSSLAGNNRALGATLGGLGGAAIGGSVGSALDQRDCQQAQLALQQMASARTGQPVPWSDSATGNRGTFTPLSDPTKTADGHICRQYHRVTVMSDGQQTDGGNGLTCRDAHGDWQAQS